jgi:hypothetical protein
MFSNPLVATMSMQMLCFVGIVVIFIFVIRSLAAMNKEMREAFRKQRMFLSDLERQFMKMDFTLRHLQGEGEDTENAGRASASLLSQGDDLLSMLEATARGASARKGAYDDQLLPPSLASSSQRPLSEEYDPAKDPHLFDDSLLSGGSGYSSTAENALLPEQRPLKKDRR